MAPIHPSGGSNREQKQRGERRAEHEFVAVRMDRHERAKNAVEDAVFVVHASRAA